MTKKIVLGVAAVALAAIVMTPSASAACGSLRNASTFAGGGPSYWHPASGAGTISAQTWQLGAPGAWNTGNCTGFVYFTDGSSTDLNLNLNLAGCGNGCPASGSTLVVLTQNKTATGTDFLLDTVVETPANPGANFDYGSQGDHNLVPIPRPRVTSSSRTGPTVNLQVAVDSIAAGLVGPNAASAVTGYRIIAVSAPAANATDPGRDAASYPTTVATVPAPGGTAGSVAAVVDCTNTANDVWLATQILFEGGTVLADAVGPTTRVKCNPALADPKFKVLPKKTMTNAPVRD